MTALRPLASLLVLMFPLVGLAEDTLLPAMEVYGQGEFRQVQTYHPADYGPALPGESPLRALNQLSGIHFQTADPFGAYEWASRISARGFNQAQLGFTLDDIPLGDMYYSTLNGLYIGRALISENLDRIRVSQGTGALDTASTSNLGGTIQFYSQDPAEKANTRIAQTLGSYNSQRTFLRHDTGRLDNDGKLYVAAVHQTTDLWKGQGHQGYDQINLKYTQSLGDKFLTAYFNYSDRQEMDYQDMTKAWIKQLGYRWTNYWPDLSAAMTNASATDGCCGTPANANQSVSDPLNAAYYYASGVRKDYLGYVSLEGSLDATTDWKTSVYGHVYQGVNTWATPDKVTPGANGAPLSERVVTYDSQRFGTLATISRQMANHRLNTGLWVERNEARQSRLFFPIYQTGSLWSPYEIPDNSTAFHTDFAYRFTTDTVQFHLQDTWAIHDRLMASAGFKSLYSGTTGTNTLNGTRPQGYLAASAPLLPQFGLKWQLENQEELFLDVTQTMRSYQQAIFGKSLSPWAVSNQAAFNWAREHLRPETAWTYEAGYRFRGALDHPIAQSYQGVVSVYHVDFKDRLLNIAGGGSLINVTSSAAILTNIGDVTMDGMEISGTLNMGQRLQWRQSLSLNRSTYNTDYFNGSRVIPIAGKTVVDSPQLLYKSHLAYRQGRYTAFLEADYLSERYFTYTNDQSVPGRWLFNLGAGASLGSLSSLGEARLQLNILNLFNERYVSTLGANGFTPSGDYQTLQVGPPRMLFLSLSVGI